MRSNSVIKTCALSLTGFSALLASSLAQFSRSISAVTLLLILLYEKHHERISFSGDVPASHTPLPVRVQSSPPLFDWAIAAISVLICPHQSVPLASLLLGTCPRIPLMFGSEAGGPQPDSQLNKYKTKAN